MKSRIALYAGYFVAMLLIAAYLTGVLQQGVLPRFGSQATAPQQEDEQPADTDQQSTSQESDQAHETESASEEQTLSQPAKDTPPVQSPPQATERPAASAVAPPPRSGEQPSTISDQEKVLADKRAELLRLEEQIRKRKEENRIEEMWLAELKATGVKLTQERDARREAGVRKLAKLYEGMEPEAAASILSKLKKDMATEVLASMKDRQAAKVLAAMNGQQAKELSERLEDVKLEQVGNQGKAMETTQ